MNSQNTMNDKTLQDDSAGSMERHSNPASYISLHHFDHGHGGHFLTIVLIISHHFDSFLDHFSHYTLDIGLDLFFLHSIYYCF